MATRYPSQRKVYGRKSSVGTPIINPLMVGETLIEKSLPTSPFDRLRASRFVKDR